LEHDRREHQPFHFRMAQNFKASSIESSLRNMADQDTIDLVKTIEVDKYKYGFETDIESDYAPKGLNEDIVRFISDKKGEPQWMLDWRLEAYRAWLHMEDPTWAKVSFPKIDYQDLYYYAAPKSMAAQKAWTRLTPSF